MARNFEFNMNDYSTVAERIAQFIKDFPEGSLQSEIIKDEEIGDKGFREIVIRAYAYRWPDDARPGIGHAHEVWDGKGKNFINENSLLENGETSAWGRALAALGYSGNKNIASREEMDGAANRRNPHKITELDKEGAEQRDAELALFARVQELHNQLGVADSPEGKVKLLVDSGVAETFKGMSYDQLVEYADYLDSLKEPGEEVDQES